MQPGARAQDLDLGQLLCGRGFQALRQLEREAKIQPLVSSTITRPDRGL